MSANSSKHYEIRHKNNYIAKLRESGNECSEVVFFKGEQIHSATFPTSYLGSAKRGEYLECMVSSIAREHKQNLAQSEHEYELSLRLGIAEMEIDLQ